MLARVPRARRTFLVVECLHRVHSGVHLVENSFSCHGRNGNISPFSKFVGGIKVSPKCYRLLWSSIWGAWKHSEIGILWHLRVVSGSKSVDAVASVGVVPELLQNPSSCCFIEITPKLPMWFSYFSLSPTLTLSWWTETDGFIRHFSLNLSGMISLSPRVWTKLLFSFLHSLLCCPYSSH